MVPLIPCVPVLRRLAPGILLSAIIAAAAVIVEPLVRPIFPIPAMVIALILGAAASGVAARPVFEPGITWCVSRLLRVAIALLGLRIALLDILDLGLTTGLMVAGSMALTILSAFLFARVFGLSAGYGALAGAATAVCGASATLATSTVVPNYPNKATDVVFTVIAANAVATLAMVAYPPLASVLHLDASMTGILLGATIHDMAQVIGAGYAISEPVGNTAVVVKLFRIFLLLPVVLVIGWWFTHSRTAHSSSKVPVPVFALVFVGLSLINSIMPAVPSLTPVYAPIKTALGMVATGGLLVAIAALGLKTSFTAILRIGWRHITVFLGATFVLLFLVVAGVLMLGEPVR